MLVGYVGKWVSLKTAIYSWEFGARHFHIQKTAHWMHWISFKGHLKKVFYSGGRKIEFDLNGSETL